MNLLSEKRDVQIALIDYLIGIGWEYITPSKAYTFSFHDAKIM